MSTNDHNEQGQMADAFTRGMEEGKRLQEASRDTSLRAKGVRDWSRESLKERCARERGTGKPGGTR